MSRRCDFPVQRSRQRRLRVYCPLNVGVTLGLLLCLLQSLAPCPDAPALPAVASTDILSSHAATIVVTSTADSGPDTLRQALLDAQGGDTITFDTAIFPPTSPMTITLTSGLPEVRQGNLTIDASNAGVVLDGSQAVGDWVPGLVIDSEWNMIQGLQIVHFSGAGLLLNSNSRHNTIGGDRGVGSGPLGQGNLSSDNNDGIGLNGAVDNTILGNLIGTDVSGTSPFGNRVVGIFLDEGAKQNVIGPGNIIAYNGDFGIDIRSNNSFGNTITQNSIHDNTRAGIHLPQSGNFNLTAPIILDFDIQAGTLAGIACDNCTVEIFSTLNDEGEILEGQATADEFGGFTFNKGTSFNGPHLTTTATDADGNTSEFSVPTSGTSRSLILQEGNHLPRTLLRTKQSSELEDNRIGGQWGGLWQPFDSQGILNTEIIGMGLKRVRLAINSMGGDTIAWDMPEFSIDPSHDDWITDIANNRVTITYVLTFWDKAVGKGENCPRFRTEEEIQRYLNFVRFIVHHFRDRVRYFELWNEPDIGVCVQRIEVEDYINLAEQVVPVIRQEYPEARIKVGGTMHLREPESHDYLFSILRSDIMPLIDAISWHLGPSISPEYEYWREYYYEYPSLVQEIKDIASAHGFKGEYIADEQTWWTPETVPPYEQHLGTYSETVAAKYYARGIVMHLGMDVTVGLGGTSSTRMISFRAIQNLCAIMAGVEPVGIPIEIQSEATNIRSYGFSLPNGDRLFALWTDGAAVDDDPGVPATLTFNGFSDHKVTGIDILHGFEQQLITTQEGGNLVIRDLLVKDYPTILRLTPTRYVFLPMVLKGYAR